MKRLFPVAFLFVMTLCASAQTAQEHLDKGVDAYQKKLYDNAIIELDQALSMDTTLTVGYFYRGLAFCGVNSFYDAIPDFERATKLAPQRDDYWVYLGMSYDLGRKDKANALLSLNRALSINPASKEAYFRRGVLYFSMLEDAKACVDFRKAAELGHNQAPNFVAKYCAN